MSCCGHSVGFIAPKGGLSFVFRESWAHVGSGFGGLIWLISSGGSHSFIICSFIEQMFFELSLGTGFCVRSGNKVENKSQSLLSWSFHVRSRDEQVGTWVNNYRQRPMLRRMEVS